jgi:hypothetical protein
MVTSGSVNFEFYSIQGSSDSNNLYAELGLGLGILHNMQSRQVSVSVVQILCNTNTNTYIWIFSLKYNIALMGCLLSAV